MQTPFLKVRRCLIFLLGAVPQFLVGTIKGDVYIINNTFPKLEVSPWQLRVKGDILLKSNNFSFLPRHGLEITVQHRISLVENQFHHLGPEAFLYIKPEGEVTWTFTWVWWSVINSLMFLLQRPLSNINIYKICIVLQLYNQHWNLAWVIVLYAPSTGFFKVLISRELW